MIGVYVLFYKRKAVYIGKTECWPSRLAGHKDLVFTDARLIECKKSQLNATEKRLIEVFRPRYNFLHTAKKSGHKITEKWVSENGDLILECLRTNDYKTIHGKAVKDLGVSPRYSSTDLVFSVIRKYERAKNVGYSWKRKRFYQHKEAA